MYKYKIVVVVNSQPQPESKLWQCSFLAKGMLTVEVNTL